MRLPTAALLLLTAISCGDSPGDSAPPREPAVAPLYLEMVRALDPLPDATAERVAVALDGVPIRCGDFDRLERLVRRTSPPDLARQPILEQLFLGALLPRAIVLRSIPPATLRSIAAGLRRCRGEEGRYDLERLTRELASHSGIAVDAILVRELVPRVVQGADPIQAEALSRLERAGQQCGPFFSRYGVFVIELAEPLAGAAALTTPRHCRLGGLLWRDPRESGSAATWLRDEMRSAINDGRIEVLDERYRLAIPEWFP